MYQKEEQRKAINIIAANFRAKRRTASDAEKLKDLGTILEGWDLCGGEDINGSDGRAHPEEVPHGQEGSEGRVQHSDHRRNILLLRNTSWRPRARRPDATKDAVAAEVAKVVVADEEVESDSLDRKKQNEEQWALRCRSSSGSFSNSSILRLTEGYIIHIAYYINNSKIDQHLSQAYNMPASERGKGRLM